MIVVPSFFKGATINTKMRLAHELLSSPETCILKWLGYKTLKIGRKLVLVMENDVQVPVSKTYLDSVNALNL